MSASADARVILVTISPTGDGIVPGLAAVHVLDGSGLSVWRAFGAMPGRPIQGRLSQDSGSALVFRAAEPRSPAMLSVRDAATGAIRWERRTRNAPCLIADASADLRSVVAGYWIESADSDVPTGLVESYRDGELVSSATLEVPAIPKVLTPDSIALAYADGGLERRAWIDGEVGAVTWRKDSDEIATILSGENTVVTFSYGQEKYERDTIEVTIVSAYDLEGKRLIRQEFRATVPYRPTLSRDGLLLALMPQRPHNGEPPLLMRLDEPGSILTLPSGVTALDFEIGDGHMLVGTKAGTVGIARVPS